MVTTTNSLVGRSTGDNVGQFTFPMFQSDHYLVQSYNWANRKGALTWGNGKRGIRGAVSNSNSLVGSQSGDLVGIGHQELASGHYVVSSFFWSNGSMPQVGAVTWCDGFNGRTGIITASNSLLGDQPMKGLSLQATGLQNGNYVVSNPTWANGSRQEAGAVRWCPGNQVTAGGLDREHSLVGDKAYGHVGTRVTPLENGNYVVSSWNWPNKQQGQFGAVTQCSGQKGRIGVVSEQNSLIGIKSTQSSVFDIEALTNGHFVVTSTEWSDPDKGLSGAATWCSGYRTVTGRVSPQNSLVGGSSPSSRKAMTTTALKNGHYVVTSPGWDNGTRSEAGAVTWCNGDTGKSGRITTANSLVGTRKGDSLGSGSIAALQNGNYVVASPDWARGSLNRAGAATWCDGNAVRTGQVTSFNSLVGSSADDQVGSTIAALQTGNYVVGSPDWDNGNTQDTGAATWGDGSTGIKGTISPSNSLVGSRQGDAVGTFTFPFGAVNRNDYIVISREWQSGSLEKAGAVTEGDGSKGTTGYVNQSNSVRGRKAFAGNTLMTNFHTTLKPIAGVQLLVGQPKANLISIFKPSEPQMPEIVVQQPAGSPLIAGESKRTFGTATVGGRNGMTRTFVIKNTGRKALTGISLAKIGTHAQAFRIKKSPASSLAPGTQTTFSISFAPTSAGDKSATLRIGSNDADENPFEVKLAGRGVKP